MADAISNRSDAEWSTWFRVHAERYFIHKQPRRSWQEVPDIFDPRSEIDEQLSRYVSSLDPAAQAAARRGLVACLVANLPWRSEYLDVFALYVRLSQRLGCAELLETGFFEKALFDGPLGYFDEQRDSDESECLFEVVLLAIRSFARSGYGDQAAKLLQRMLVSPRFPKHLLYWAFLSLCEAQPDSLFDHWGRIRRLHHALQEDLARQGKSTDIAVIARELVSCTSLEVLGETIVDLFGMSDFRSSDYWLIEVLSSGTDKALVIEKRSGETAIRFQGQDAEVVLKPLEQAHIDNILNNVPPAETQPTGESEWSKPLAGPTGAAAMVRFESLFGVHFPSSPRDSWTPTSPLIDAVRMPHGSHDTHLT